MTTRGSVIVASGMAGTVRSDIAVVTTRWRPYSIECFRALRPSWAPVGGAVSMAGDRHGRIGARNRAKPDLISRLGVYRGGCLFRALDDLPFPVAGTRSNLRFPRWCTHGAFRSRPSSTGITGAPSWWFPVKTLCRFADGGSATLRMAISSTVLPEQGFDRAVGEGSIVRHETFTDTDTYRDCNDPACV